jgi:hypothetical protein
MPNELVILHRTSNPFTPHIPQTSVCSVSTQTHYSVAPVQIDPPFTPFLGRQSSMRSTRPPTLGRLNSNRSLANNSFMTVFNDTPSPKATPSDDEKTAWCCCLS